ncbi:MAG: LPS export ABC transporter periplasmic protein LptC [Gammaproteobacteria bacterium]|nr:LPS export ABC transporter periplasmic protein LptC [Gammaproteobacteria bacterium]
MNWSINKLMITVILLALLILTVWLPNALVTPVISLRPGRPHQPDYIIRNFTVTTMSKLGQPKYVLTARTLIHYPNRKSARLTQPRLIQYTPGAPAVYTSAERGRVYNDGKELLMTGDVKVDRGRNNRTPAGQITTHQLRIVLD